MSKVFDLMQELAKIVGERPIDIEFAETKDGQLYLLQLRQLITPRPKIMATEHENSLRRIENFLNSNMRPHPFLKGETTAYGVMTDWNPAEIIGIKPKSLAISLYRELITDNIWAYQRNNYGYRNLRSFPLLVEFSGLPYIDIRVSFNSFVPDSLSDELAEKLINFYIKKLKQNPHLHDKVEFDIVLSCFTLDLDERLRELSEHNFSVSEINELRSALLSLTNKIINPKDGLMVSDAQRVEKLKLRRSKLSSPVFQIYKRFIG